LLVGLALLLAACGGNAGTPASTPDGPQISLTTNPDPAQIGSVDLVATIKDAQGQPITDAQVFIFIDHRDMAGMGNEYEGVMQEDGRYIATADLEMGGRWRITIQVNQPPQRTVEDFNLEVK
jgi:hypothetical protein